MKSLIIHPYYFDTINDANNNINNTSISTLNEITDEIKCLLVFACLIIVTFGFIIFHNDSPNDSPNDSLNNQCKIQSKIQSTKIERFYRKNK